MPGPIQERWLVAGPMPLDEPLETGHEAVLATVALADLGDEIVPLVGPLLLGQDVSGRFEVAERRVVLFALLRFYDPEPHRDPEFRDQQRV